LSKPKLIKSCRAEEEEELTISGNSYLQHTGLAETRRANMRFSIKKKGEGYNLTLTLFFCYVTRDAITCRTKPSARSKFVTDE
jgi:hypothetical protein